MSLASAAAPAGANRLAALADDLASSGWSLVDGLFSDAALDELRTAAKVLDAAPAGLGRQGEALIDQSVRRAEIAWLSAPSRSTPRFFAEAEGLRCALNERLFLGLFEFEAGFATYPPGGFYARHRDALRGERNRVVSLVVYLHPDWRADWGGALIVYGLEGAEAERITPLGGRAVLLLSEEIEHEVEPTTAQAPERLALAAWWRVNASSAERVDPAA